MHMIADEVNYYHLSILYRRLSARPCRVLYVGLDCKLLQYLEDRLDDCWFVRAAAGCVARSFIEHLEYSLLLFDETLMDMSGRELATLTRGMERRQSVPIVIVRPGANCERLARKLDGLLAESRAEARRMAALKREWWGRSRLTSLECCGW